MVVIIPLMFYLDLCDKYITKFYKIMSIYTMQLMRLLGKNNPCEPFTEFTASHLPFPTPESKRKPLI